MTPQLQPDPAVFGALGDATRLQLIARLKRRPGQSTSALTAGTRMTRQAVGKHLQVLEGAGLVRGEREGRERLWTLDPRPLALVADWVEDFRALWEARFDRLDDYLQTLQHGADDDKEEG